MPHGGMRRIPALHIGALHVLWLLLAACTGQVASQQVPGVYVLADKNTRDTIRISENGEFTRTHTSRTGDVHTERGTWAFSGGHGRTQISLEGFTDYVEAENYRVPPVRGTWMPVVEHGSRGQLRLVVSDDEGLYYEQIQVQHD